MWFGLQQIDNKSFEVRSIFGRTDITLQQNASCNWDFKYKEVPIEGGIDLKLDYPEQSMHILQTLFVGWIAGKINDNEREVIIEGAHKNAASNKISSRSKRRGFAKKWRFKTSTRE